MLNGYVGIGQTRHLQSEVFGVNGLKIWHVVQLCTGRDDRRGSACHVFVRNFRDVKSYGLGTQGETRSSENRGTPVVDG